MTVEKEITNTRGTLDNKQGSNGKKINLTANYFAINTLKDWDIFQYRVDFSPDIPDTKIRKSLIDKEKSQIGGNCFDGTMLFTVKKLKVEEIVTKLPTTDEVIQIKFRFTGIMSRTDQRFLQIYNIILNRAMSKLNLTQLGRNYYDSKAAIQERAHNIELWPGYMTSVRQHEHKILLNVEIGYKFLRMDTVRHLWDQCGGNTVRMTNVAVGQIVITDYNNTTYRVDSIDFTKNPESTFDKNGEQISYMKYYKDRYGIVIRDTKQALLVSNANARQRRGGAPEQFYLIPELCRLTGLADEMRSDMRLMRDLSNYTRVDPRGRQTRLMEFSRRMAEAAEAQSSFQEFGLQLERQLVKVTGRVLNPNDIVFGGDRKVSGAKADWTGDLQREKLFSTRDKFTNWAVLSTSRASREIEGFVSTLRNVARNLGIEMSPPTIQILQFDRTPEYVRELEKLCQGDPQMLVVVVPNDNAETYSAIKKILSVKRAVLSQVLLSRTVGMDPSKVKSVATKVAIQMNAKMGNAPWKVPIPLKGLMVIGFDVCHDTRDRSKSFAAFIASMDQTTSDVYYSAASAHRNGEELCNQFGQMTMNAVKCYHEIHGKLPDRILVYRDGVGDGQLQFVIDHEVQQLRDVLKEMYGGTEPKMAFVVVTKRISARFFNNDFNVPAGTVVDDVVTLPERYDFFLVSQNVRQGTATPTNYNVIYDKIALSPDHLQILTQKLCHMYYNWSGTVRVPNVCQYAHKLSLLVGQYFHEEPNPLLAQKLYFL